MNSIHAFIRSIISLDTIPTSEKKRGLDLYDYPTVLNLYNQHPDKMKAAITNKWPNQASSIIKFLEENKSPQAQGKWTLLLENSRKVQLEPKQSDPNDPFIMPKAPGVKEPYHHTDYFFKAAFNRVRTLLKEVEKKMHGLNHPGL